LGEHRRDTSYKIFNRDDGWKRPPVAFSAGPHIKDVLMPHADPQETETTLCGVKKRMAFVHPKRDPDALPRLKKFVLKWCQGNLTPLSPDSDLSPETWLKQTNYPQWRKDNLLKNWAENKFSFDRHVRVKCFMKDEFNVDYKYPRGIYSREDMFKVASGPIFKLIEKELFSKSYFIKKIPVRDRPQYIIDLLYRHGYKYLVTDYTAFESHFDRELQESCEMVMYRYMIQYLPDNEYFENLFQVLLGKQVCNFKTFSAKFKQTRRLSGEMNTSLGNGFTNLMVLLFLAEEKGCTDLRAVIEGDDCLASMNGPQLEQSDYAKLGFTVKIEWHDQLNTASFCGLVFDVEDRMIVCDPRPKLVTFAWLPNRYVRAKHHKIMGLIRAKSLSFLYQFPGCPVVAELALYGLRMTEGYRLKVDSSMDMFHTDRLREAINYYSTHSHYVDEIPIATRLLVEEKFGMTVEEQLRIEDLLSNKQDLEPIILDVVFPDSWHDYATRYCYDVVVGVEMDFPPIFR